MRWWEHDRAMESFTESVRVPPWWYVVLAAVAAVIGTDFAYVAHLRSTGLARWLPVVVLWAAGAVVLARMGSGRVRLDDRGLHVGRNRLPYPAMGRVGVVDKARALGPALDERAFVATRFWLRRVVRVDVSTDADPTPYWLVGSRHPERLLAAIEDARTRVSAGP